MIAYVFAILGCIGFGVARLVMPAESVIHKEDIFKDMAHLFVGTQYGCAIFATAVFYLLRVAHDKINCRDSFYKVSAPIIKFGIKFFWITAIGMTILEVVAFKLHQQ